MSVREAGSTTAVVKDREDNILGAANALLPATGLADGTVMVVQNERWVQAGIVRAPGGLFACDATGTMGPNVCFQAESTGDNFIVIQADTDNVNESDNPMAVFTQDRDTSGAEFGLDAGNTFEIVSANGGGGRILFSVAGGITGGYAGGGDNSTPPRVDKGSFTYLPVLSVDGAGVPPGRPGNVRILDQSRLIFGTTGDDAQAIDTVDSGTATVAFTGAFDADQNSTMTYERVRDRVTLQFTEVSDNVTTPGSISLVAGTIPAGFRPAGQLQFVSVAALSGGTEVTALAILESTGELTLQVAPGTAPNFASGVATIRAFSLTYLAA